MHGQLCCPNRVDTEWTVVSLATDKYLQESQGLLLFLDIFELDWGTSIKLRSFKDVFPCTQSSLCSEPGKEHSLAIWDVIKIGSLEPTANCRDRDLDTSPSPALAFWQHSSTYLRIVSNRVQCWGRPDLPNEHAQEHAQWGWEATGGPGLPLPPCISTCWLVKEAKGHGSASSAQEGVCLELYSHPLCAL